MITVYALYRRILTNPTPESIPCGHKHKYIQVRMLDHAGELIEWPGQDGWLIWLGLANFKVTSCHLVTDFSR